MKIEDSQYLNLPIGLLEYSYIKKYIKALAIYIYFKRVSNGVLNERAINWKDVKEKTGIRDRRTFYKHFALLLKLNWVGFNKASKNYFIRGFQPICESSHINIKSSVRLYDNDIRRLKSFIEASIIGKSVRGQKYATERAIIKQSGHAALINGRALQAYREENGYPLYYGLSNERIAKLLRTSKSHGNRAKLNAEKNGYLRINKKEEEIVTLPCVDYNIRHSLPDSHKIRVKRNSNGSIKVYKQLHDEIIPFLEFSRRRN